MSLELMQKLLLEPEFRSLQQENIKDLIVVYHHFQPQFSVTDSPDEGSVTLYFELGAPQSLEDADHGLIYDLITESCDPTKAAQWVAEFASRTNQAATGHTPSRPRV
ncbi:hypothetical protein ACKF11_13885 [Methylobacillus sp. Pita2]|uniref:hypothetical protein n=1 Tax=Methylobacillus sp. Pita2 TaxID=3383245 RepID=UPI0038B498A3